MYTYKYPRAALTTDSIVYVHEEGETFILLIERGSEPFKNKWALPGGFIEMNETLESACRRELFEETGLELNELKQFRAYDAVDRDPRSRTISVVHYAKLDQMVKVQGLDDAISAKWFPISELPELAFDHQQILVEFFEWLNLPY